MMPDQRFQGKRVSTEWDIVLTEAARQGVNFTLNSGKRTMAEQWVLYNGYRKGLPGYNLAAFPNPNAPHVRVGRPDHAIDVDSINGGETRLQSWLQKQGVHPTNPVAGESWHMELPAEELRKLATRFGSVHMKVLKRGQKGPTVVRLKKLLWDKGFRNFSGDKSSNRYNPFFSIYTEEAVKRFQAKNGIKADGIVGPATWKALSA